MPAKRARAAAVAVVLAATPLALASPAFAASGPHHPPTSPGLTGAKRGADAVLTQYTRRLGMIEAREARELSSTVINSTVLDSLESATKSEAGALVVDKRAARDATIFAAVRAAVASGRTTLSEAVLDWQVVVAADRIEARDATLATEQAAAAEAAASTTAANTAVTVVTSLAAAPIPSAVRAARTAATGDLRVARQDLAAALHDASRAAHLLAKI